VRQKYIELSLLSDKQDKTKKFKEKLKGYDE
jgi:hypothetical protein